MVDLSGWNSCIQWEQAVTLDGSRITRLGRAWLMKQTKHGKLILTVGSLCIQNCSAGASLVWCEPVSPILSSGDWLTYSHGRVWSPLTPTHHFLSVRAPHTAPAPPPGWELSLCKPAQPRPGPSSINYQIIRSLGFLHQTWGLLGGGKTEGMFSYLCEQFSVI